MKWMEMYDFVHQAVEKSVFLNVPFIPKNAKMELLQSLLWT